MWNIGTNQKESIKASGTHQLSHLILLQILPMKIQDSYHLMVWISALSNDLYSLWLKIVHQYSDLKEYSMIFISSHFHKISKWKRKKKCHYFGHKMILIRKNNLNLSNELIKKSNNKWYYLCIKSYFCTCFYI